MSDDIAPEVISPPPTWKFYAVIYAVLMVPLAACFGVTYQQNAYQQASERQLETLIYQGYNLPGVSRDQSLSRQLGFNPKYHVQPAREPSYSSPTYHPPSRSLSEPTYYNPSPSRDWTEYDGREKTVRVRPYYRKDGTFVRGHMRRPPRSRR